MANTYGLNFIKIGGIWIFRGQKPSIRGGYIWPMMPIFELEWAIPVKSHVWKFGLDWLKSEVCKISGGGGVTCDRWCPFSYMAEQFQLKILCEHLVGLVEPFKSYRGNRQKKKKKKNHRRDWKQYLRKNSISGGKNWLGLYKITMPGYKSDVHRTASVR